MCFLCALWLLERPLEDCLCFDAIDRDVSLVLIWDLIPWSLAFLKLIDGLGSPSGGLIISSLDSLGTSKLLFRELPFWAKIVACFLSLTMLERGVVGSSSLQTRSMLSSNALRYCVYSDPDEISTSIWSLVFKYLKGIFLRICSLT